MNKTRKIYNELKKRLESGFYPANSRFPSENLLADEFQVNKMTINKIVSLLVEQQYLLRGIRGAGTRVADLDCRCSGLIAFISPLTGYAVQILHGIYCEALRNNFTVLVESPAAGELQQRLLILRSMGVKCVISATYGLPLMPENMRLFCVDSEPRPAAEGQTVNFINSNNFQGGYNMMQEILRRGHRNILVFSNQRFHHRFNAPKTPRVNGFHSAMASAGISDCEQRTFYSAHDSREDAMYFLQHYLKKSPNTTLIAADSDPAAELIHAAALKIGIDCPGEINLTGFGNISNLPIASVNQNPERQGVLAARYAIEYTASGECSAPESLEVDTSISGAEYINICLNSN